MCVPKVPAFGHFQATSIFNVYINNQQKKNVFSYLDRPMGVGREPLTGWILKSDIFLLHLLIEK